MEDFIKFVFYAVIFVIYVVSQIRKAKNKKAEEEAQRAEPNPTPVVEYQSRKSSSNQPVNSSRQEEKSGGRTERARKPLLKAKGSEVAKVQVEYQTLDMIEADEVLKNKKGLEGSRILKERLVQMDEHLTPYVLEREKEKKNSIKWLKNKSTLKQAFIASEIFNRKY